MESGVPKIKVVLGGHWDTTLTGWDIKDQSQQDIRQPLKWDDNSVDCLFLEHVLEHIDKEDSIKFFSEAYRVLKVGGVLRIIMPDRDRCLGFKLITDRDRELFTSWFGWYDEKTLAGRTCGEIMLRAMREDYEHKYIWGEREILDELTEAHFSARSCPLGQGYNDEYCIERRWRGVKEGGEWYDAQSMFVEGVKLTC